MPTTDSENEEQALLDRIEALKQRLQELGAEECALIEHTSLDVQEKFLRSLVAFEEQAGNGVPLFETLMNSGISLPPPDQLDGDQVTVFIWQIINGLALIGVYLHSTDHLSDRELYS